MIHLPSSQLKSIHQESSVQYNHALTTLNDQESYNNQSSNNQGDSFQSLIKKDENDSVTRNTQWSENYQDPSLTSQILDNQNQNQNQNSQKIISFTTVWKFHDEFSQPLEIQEYKKKSTQKIDSIKKSLLENRNQKMNKLRNLLPYFYNVHLPKQMKRMLTIADQIDKHLIQKKNADYTENVQNILKTIFYEEEMSTIWSTIKKLLFICESYYKIRIDPLKNICLGFANKKDNRLANRKQRLRKAIADYYTEQNDGFQWENVPEILTEPTKTFRFYPENLNIQPKNIEKKLKPQYLDQLKQRVKSKDIIILQKNENNLIKKASPSDQLVQPLSSLSQLESFCDLVTEIYSQKKVHHMYKVSLIEHLRKKKTYSLEKIFSLLKYIQEEGIFLEVLIKSSCQILKINQKERKSLIQIYKYKLTQKKIL